MMSSTSSSLTLTSISTSATWTVLSRSGEVISSAAALRANEIHADILLKATKVDGLYTADPEKDPKAVKLPEVTYQEVLEKDLRVMDTAAISLCRDNGIPIAIFDMTTAGNIGRVVQGERVGSIVRG